MSADYSYSALQKKQREILLKARSNQTLNNVTFLVGKNRIEIGANRAFLAEKEVAWMLTRGIAL